MEQIEVISWKVLDAIKQSASIIDTIGDLDTDEQMSVFCSIEEDFFELYYSELEANYIRHFDDEEELNRYIDARKSEFGEEDFETAEYYEEEIEADEFDEEYSGYKIKDGEEDNNF